MLPVPEFRHGASVASQAAPSTTIPPPIFSHLLVPQFPQGTSLAKQFVAVVPQNGKTPAIYLRDSETTAAPRARHRALPAEDSPPPFANASKPPLSGRPPAAFFPNTSAPGNR